MTLTDFSIGIALGKDGVFSLVCPKGIHPGPSFLTIILQ
jgi:hypothetical protein